MFQLLAENAVQIDGTVFFRHRQNREGVAALIRCGDRRKNLSSHLESQTSAFRLRVRPRRRVLFGALVSEQEGENMPAHLLCVILRGEGSGHGLAPAEEFHRIGELHCLSEESQRDGKASVVLKKHIPLFGFFLGFERPFLIVTHSDIHGPDAVSYFFSRINSLYPCIRHWRRLFKLICQRRYRCSR